RASGADGSGRDGMLKRASVGSVAEAYLELLAARGVEYFFANAGTDFAPIVEAYARRAAQGQALPRPITVPHETTAVALAHGYAMVTGRPQVVMVHVIVGTANALGGIMNAARANVPMLVTAGRTPITEAGMPGSRNLHIHWAQEAFDQGAIAREFVKWDYELRLGARPTTVGGWALALARSEPAGPVHPTLPRAVLAAPPYPLQSSAAPPRAAGRDPEAVRPLVALAEALGMPVFDQWHTYVNFPHDHPLHAGFDPAPYLGDADLVVVLESDVPWFPAVGAPRAEATVVQIGHDPLFSRYPIRGFAVDVALPGLPRLTLTALAEAVRAEADARSVAARRQRW